MIIIFIFFYFFGGGELFNRGQCSGFINADQFTLYSKCLKVEICGC